LEAGRFIVEGLTAADDVGLTAADDVERFMACMQFECNSQSVRVNVGFEIAFEVNANIPSTYYAKHTPVVSTTYCLEDRQMPESLSD